MDFRNKVSKPSAHQLYLAACERMKARGFSPEVIAAFQVVRVVTK